MLHTLYVKDFAIVGEAEIAFVRGMTVITGETGAGKSLLVDALVLLSGDRAETGVVRHGCERAELLADFDLSDAPAARQWLDAEAFDDDRACQLRRVIRAEGGSRAWINGRPCTLAQMQALAVRLIEIHGQHEHQALLDRTEQLALLDAFGHHADDLARVARLAARWREVDAQMRELEGDVDHSDRIALLEHQIAELDRHALDPGELDTLNATHKRLANAGQLIASSAALGELFDGDHDANLRALLARAQNELVRLGETDSELARIRDLVEAAQIQIGEANDTLARYRDTLDLDPDRLAETETQIARLHELARKHRLPPGELKGHAERLRAELATLQDAGASLVRLGHERNALERDWRSAAATLTQARAATATRFAREVSALMAELGMPGGRFVATLEANSKTDPDPAGAERVEFLISANPGQPPRPLRKVASGGELARIGLAIEVAALGARDGGGDPVATMVFDEVDAGIGGAVAEIVGQKLRRLGSRHQVLCVTHLPQVAAQAHAHLRVAKSSDGATTETRIEALDASTRGEEIARMLGGIEITRETLAHAAQMLAAVSGES